ncbi:hypothetical protein D3C76_1573940 [compost metagenome]
MQLEVEGEVQALRYRGLQRGKGHMHPAVQQAVAAAGLEVQGLAVQARIKRIAEATDIPDAHRQEWLLEAVVGEALADAVIGRHQNLPADLAVALVQPRLVDAPGAQFGVHAAD